MGIKYYIGLFELFDRICFFDLFFMEDLLCLDIFNFYYILEDILFEEVGKNDGLIWFVYWFIIIFGFFFYSLMNVVGILCVYVVICKYEGVFIKFLGMWGVWECYL